MTLHPAVPGTSRRPDFYVERAGSGFYLEAIAPGTSQAAKAAAQRRAVLFSTVDRLKSADFILWLSELTEGPGQPASAKLRNGLERWLASLRVDDYSSADLAPEWRWEHDGWAASFKAIPKGEGARGISRAGRAIGVYAHTGAIRVDDALSIRAALTEKHHAYGDLDAPFVIAVGTYIFDSDRWHSTNAFYGHEAMQLSQGPDGEWTVIDTELNVCGCGCGGVALSGG